MEQYPLPDKDYMVLIRCFTYNHEAYIEDALKGFVMQKTDFPFVAVVVDDASTDRTADIIRKYEKEYPDIIKGVYLKENHYSQKKKKAPYIQPWRDRCKYEAICEGDDYWIDPLKLQKQVDFLEKHPEYGLICSEVNAYNEQSKSFNIEYFKNKKWDIKYTFEDFLINAWFLAPCTWLYRKEFLKNDIAKNNFIVGDLPLLIEISYKSKIKFLKEVTAIYRIIPKSASHGLNYQQEVKYKKGILQIQLYYINKYNRQDLTRKIISRWLLIMAKISYNFHKYNKMLHYLFYYISHNLQMKTIKDI